MSKLVKAGGLVQAANGFSDAVARELQNAEDALSDKPAVTTKDPSDSALLPIDSSLKRRKYMLPMGPGDVPAGGNLTLQVTPQSLFRAQRVLFGGALRDVLLFGVFVGLQPQIPGSDRIPLALWTNESLDWEMLYGRKLDVVPVGIPLTMQFYNQGNETRRIDVLIIGEALI